MSTSVDVPFRVVVEPFAEKHYIKDFQKKYKSQWLSTRKAIVAQFNNIDLLLESGRLTPPILNSPDKCAIHKHSFRVAGTNQSAKSSGNRIILFVDYKLRTVHVLLVYNKNHIGPPNETAKWEQVTKSQYPDYYARFTNPSY